ncbi:MAG: SAVED domain-containing protein, partial [Acidimicrobiaceae bacterium]|nr:SAVED domain-containing protein [Acidimicrobiaceae bacterium]
TQVGRTRPILDDERVREAIDSLGLWAEPATATVAISALNEVPADDALIHVDLRRYFDPSKPIEGSARWSAVVSHLETTAQQCVALGHTNIMVRGSCRLPLWFVAGHSLLDTKGFDVCTVAHNRTWSSVLQPSLTSSNTIKSDKLVEASGGDSAAIAVSVVADDPTPEIIDYLTENSYSGSLFRIRRAEPSTLISAEQGQALALAIRNEARALCRHLRPSKLHLFLACPAPVALLLGRLWDRLPQTTTYEYLGSGTGYEPAVVLQSS